MNSDAPIFEDQQGSIIAPRSKSLFPSGVSLGRNSSLDADDLMRRALGTVNKAVIPDESDSAPSPIEPEINFSFKATIADATARTATMLSGGVTLGPCTRIEWSAISGASTNITVDDAAPVWFVWLAVDVRKGIEAAAWHDGESIADWWDVLSPEVKKYTTVIPLIQITSTDKATPPDAPAWSIDEVKNLQCGDGYISRV
jgi:hypothetical protein